MRVFCTECGRPITTGQSIVIRRRRVRHANCGERDLTMPAVLTGRRAA